MYRKPQQLMNICVGIRLCLTKFVRLTTFPPYDHYQLEVSYPIELGAYDLAKLFDQRFRLARTKTSNVRQQSSMIGIIDGSININANIVHDVHDGSLECYQEFVLWNLYLVDEI
jgi:hypothetical protein